MGQIQLPSVDKNFSFTRVYNLYISYILKVCWVVHYQIYHHILSPTISDFLSESLTWEDYLKESPCTWLIFEPQQCSLLCYLQQQLYTLVKEKFLSTLGSWICPIEWTPVIIQVASQLLPRVTPEKIYIEVSHCLGLDQGTCSYTLEHLQMVQLPIPAIHLWLASFFNLLSYIGGAYIGFTETQILAFTPGNCCILEGMSNWCQSHL